VSHMDGVNTKQSQGFYKAVSMSAALRFAMKLASPL
jgi:hypothetical protein